MQAAHVEEAIMMYSSEEEMNGYDMDSEDKEQTDWGFSLPKSPFYRIGDEPYN
jgi:hypothetical protein